MKKGGAKFQFKPFSLKQKKLLTWWTEKCPYHDYDMIIADGSIRSGKTISMIDSFLMWSLAAFQNQTFIIAGKSMGALKRNVLQPMFQIHECKGHSVCLSQVGALHFHWLQCVLLFRGE